MADLKRGSKGKDVVTLQERLNKAGAKPKLELDGVFGKRTEASVKAFQKKAGLKTTGVADKGTMSALAGGAKPMTWDLTDPAHFKKQYDLELKDRPSYEEYLVELNNGLDPTDGILAKKYQALLGNWKAEADNLKKSTASFVELRKKFDKGGADQEKVYKRAAELEQSIGTEFYRQSEAVREMTIIKDEIDKIYKKFRAVRWPVSIDVAATLKMADKYRAENRQMYFDSVQFIDQREGSVFKALGEELSRLNKEAEAAYEVYRAALLDLGESEREFETVKGSNKARAEVLMERGIEQGKDFRRFEKEWKSIQKRRREFQNVLVSAERERVRAGARP